MVTVFAVVQIVRPLESDSTSPEVLVTASLAVWVVIGLSRLGVELVVVREKPRAKTPPSEMSLSPPGKMGGFAGCSTKQVGKHRAFASLQENHLQRQYGRQAIYQHN
uniref:Uncharacterized protein n=1 Tax=Oryza glumipatula TaxID=40148 RepID=A0A0D9ZR86_9ORYZ